MRFFFMTFFNEGGGGTGSRNPSLGNYQIIKTWKTENGPWTVPNFEIRFVEIISILLSLVYISQPELFPRSDDPTSPRPEPPGSSSRLSSSTHPRALTL